MLLLTPLAAVPEVKVPVVVADAQLRAVRVSAFGITVLANKQLCPPKLMAKLAVPGELGVPVMVYVKFPAPVAKVPAESAAVKPVTPVDVTVWPLWVPPFPPEYGIFTFKLLGVTPVVSTPVEVAALQSSEEIDP